VGGRLLDRPGAVHGPEDVGDTQAEGVAALDFQPDLDARDQRGRLRTAARGGWHGRPPGGTVTRPAAGGVVTARSASEGRSRTPGEPAASPARLSGARLDRHPRLTRQPVPVSISK